MPRGVRVLRDAHVLAGHAHFPQGGADPEGEVRRGHGGQGRPAGHAHAARALEPAVQTAHGAGPGVHGVVPGLLRAGREAGLAGDSRKGVQQDVQGHRRLRPAVLRAGLHDAQGQAGGALQVQVPLVLRRQVQTVRENLGRARLRVRHSSLYRSTAPSLPPPSLTPLSPPPPSPPTLCNEVRVRGQRSR